MLSAAKHLAAALLGLMAGCDRQSGGDAPAFVVVTGDTAGWIVPCGCATNQSGGLPRRGTLIRELRQRGDVLLLDAGGVAAGANEYQRAKLEAILAGTLRMGLAAQNIGTAEAAFGADYLRDVARRLSVPLVSANARDADGGLIAPPIRFLKLAGRRIAVTGVLAQRVDGRSNTIAGLRIDAPRESVLRALAKNKQPYDALIVLAYLPEAELRELAAGLPEADAVIGGPTGQSLLPRQLGPTLLASATNKGKFVVQLAAHLEDSRARWSGQVVELSERFADDAAQQENVRTYLAELKRRDFAADQTGLTAPLPASLPADFAIAGTAACRECHAAEYAVWEHVDHAHAWRSLLERGYEADPDCQQCHTTGYGLPGGFVSAARSADRTSAGCENCHGPSLAHVRDPHVRTPFQPRDQCVRCHDLENSPQFDFAVYWPRIQHGPKATSATAPAATTQSPGVP
jgi:hypothetical protein